MRKKKNNTIEAAKERQQYITRLEEYAAKTFKPMAGAHKYNCDLCQYKNSCKLANWNFAFCPKQKLDEELTQVGYLSDEHLEALALCPLN